ncbi:MAG: DUF4233 domain-containing protein [Nocardioidaceae bacterium]
MCAGVLSLEAIVLALTTPVMISVSGIDKATALIGGLGLAALALLAAGMLRRPWAYWLGHLVQVGALGLGFVVPIMFLLGVVFAALWVSANVLGRKVQAGTGL